MMLENAMGTILGTAEVEHDLQTGSLRCQVCDTPVLGPTHLNVENFQ